MRILRRRRHTSCLLIYLSVAGCLFSRRLGLNILQVPRIWTERLVAQVNCFLEREGNVELALFMRCR
ncbi:hypothetical protein DL95DRAFT_398248 [Leptodontidium sp. 2 PMI_412]|nr:hypothetical protein DL95DRAFT_398248 [Leptodontidium sp. 2 PMI_412]